MLARPYLAHDRPANPRANSRAKPREKAFSVYLLYPERGADPEPARQIEVMLDEIWAHTGAAGQYVLQSHLERFYRDLCSERGWTPRHWCVAGYALGKVCDRVIKKQGTKRLTAYKIPAA